MIRETSIQAYHALLADGSIGRKQCVVLEFILAHQDEERYHGSISQVDLEMARGEDCRSSGPRFAELAYKGLIYVHGTKPSARSRHEVLGWRATKQFDTEQAKLKPDDPKRNRKAAIDSVIADLAAMRNNLPNDLWNHDLRERINQIIAKMEGLKSRPAKRAKP